MKRKTVLLKTLVWTITFLIVGICAGLMAGGIILFVQGSAAVKAQMAEAIFTREGAAEMLSLFLIPVLLLVILLIWAALFRAKKPQNGEQAVRINGRVCVCKSMSTGVCWLCLLIAAALIGAGIINGGLRDVLIKAINICTECIGLG